MSMEVENRPTEPLKLFVRGAVDSKNISAVMADDAELLDMFVFCAAFAVDTLFSFSLFGHPSISESRLAYATELEAVEDSIEP